MKNAVVVVAIGLDELLNVTLKSLLHYTNKTNSELVVIGSPKYNITSNFNNKDTYPIVGEYSYGKFEKNQIYDLFDEYDRILRLDIDTVINPDAPNVFDFDDKYLYAVREDVNDVEVHRQSELRQIQKDLGRIEGWNTHYYNGGVVLASKQHREVFNIEKIDFDLNLGILKEQNVFNWRVNKLGFEIKNLGPEFNYFTGIDPIGFNVDSVRRKAYIIHHTVQGTQNKLNGMQKDMDFFFSKIKQSKI